MTEVLLVTGATGKQGGALIESLLAAKSGHKIKALVRAPESGTAQHLASKGVELVKGDMSDAASLQSALQGVDRAFLVTTPYFPHGSDPEKETETGKAFVDAAKKAGVKYIVFSSVASADKKSEVPHFDSKLHIQEHLAASGITHSILHPVFFMDNIPKDKPNLGFWATVLEGRKLQMIATTDIGKAGAEAILNKDAFAGQVIHLAGDNLDVNEMAEAFKSVRGIEADTTPVPKAALEGAGYDMNMMFKFFVRQGYEVDISAVKKQFPQVQSFREWLKAGA